MGILTAGVSAGGMVLPPVFQKLEHEFDLTIAIIAGSCFLIMCCVGSCSFIGPSKTHKEEENISREPSCGHNHDDEQQPTPDIEKQGLTITKVAVSTQLKEFIKNLVKNLAAITEPSVF